MIVVVTAAQPGLTFDGTYTAPSASNLNTWASQLALLLPASLQRITCYTEN